MSDLSNIQFAEPQWLWLLPVILLLLWAGLRSHLFRLGLLSHFPQHTSRQIYRHPAFDLLKQIVSRQDQAAQAGERVSLVLSYAVLLLLICLSLAQPYHAGKKLPEPARYRDIMFIVDTSVSMMLRDYTVEQQHVDRMTMMKAVLSHFIEQLQGNRIGIIAFSEQAYTVTPLTSDYRLLYTQLQRLEPASLTGRTNNLAHVLLYSFKQMSVDQQAEDQHKPVLVLVTDANRPARDLDPHAAARYIGSKGYRLHTIAIGAPSYEGAEQDVNSLIYQPTNFKLLREIATATSGKFYWARNTASLQDAVLTIQQAEQRNIDVEPRYIRLPLYHWPLSLAIVWICLWQLLPFAKLLYTRTGGSRS